MPKHPTMVLIRGLPGSGKSYLAKQLQTALGSDVVMLDPDATDYQSQEYAEHVKQVTIEGVDAKLHAYRFLRTKAYQGIADHAVVLWNQPFTNLEIFNKMVANLQREAAEQHTELPLLVVEVQLDPAKAHARVMARKQAGGHGPSEATFHRFVTDYKSFADQDYRTVTVNGEAAIETSLTEVMQALQPLLG